MVTVPTLEALCSSDRSEINRKLAFSKVFLKAKSIRKVVVPCGCNTAQFELEINEEEEVSESWSRERVIFNTGQVIFITDWVIFNTQ